jgi:hypothetical protein
MYFRKDRDLEAMRKEYEERLAKLAEKHNTEFTTLVDRHMARSESWITKYAENSAAQTDALKALASRFGGRKGQ